MSQIACAIKPRDGTPMERREHLNEAPGVSGEMVIEFDIDSGQVLSKSSGFWSMPQVRAFFVDWKSAVRQIHARGQRVSALVDLSCGQVQNAEVAAYIASATTGLYAAGDTIAMLVPTSLAKMQMRRVLEPQIHEFFLSLTAAELWLNAKQQAFTARSHFAA